MKAELNYSLRLRFFGQYLNSCDCGDHGEDFRAPWDSRSMSSLLEAEQEQAFLYLRSIDQITEEESIDVSRINWPDPNDPYHSNSKMATLMIESRLFVCNDWALSSRTVDYLRSIGVAIPFMGHSVEELVEAGWIKLTNPPA